MSRCGSLNGNYQRIFKQKFQTRLQNIFIQCFTQYFCKAKTVRNFTQKFLRTTPCLRNALSQLLHILQARFNQIRSTPVHLQTVRPALLSFPREINGGGGETFSRVKFMMRKKVIIWKSIFAQTFPVPQNREEHHRRVCVNLCEQPV